MTGGSGIAWQGRYLVMNKAGTWEYVSRARDIHAVVIWALDGEHVLLVEQYRVPLGTHCLELPAGLVGDDVEGEALELAAARELEEETGYRPGRLERLGRFHTSPGMSTEAFDLVRAADLRKVGEGGGIGDENIIVHRILSGEVARLIADRRAAGCAIDAKLLMLMPSFAASPDDPGPSR